MKIRMIADWSDMAKHPKKDDELRVVDEVYGDDGEFEYYECQEL